jgi:hypothetical protein
MLRGGLYLLIEDAGTCVVDAKLAERKADTGAHRGAAARRA